MYRLVRANGTLSDMVNLIRAKDAVRNGAVEKERGRESSLLDDWVVLIW
jgi:hypothetical protein